nr:MAG TPA: hypothetical protein [Caudoviricetes sp.]
MFNPRCLTLYGQISQIRLIGPIHGRPDRRKSHKYFP